MLKRIGYALHYTKLGNLVAKISQITPLYIPVYTYTYKKIGTLYDIIGNVNNPYGLIKPNTEDNSIIGQAIYIREIDLRRAK
jgi:RNA-binding protein